MRVILAYIQKKLKGKTGKVAQALLCLLACCLWCFEKVLRYINRQAYIEVRSLMTLYQLDVAVVRGRQECSLISFTDCHIWL